MTIWSQEMRKNEKKKKKIRKDHECKHKNNIKKDETFDRKLWRRKKHSVERNLIAEEIFLEKGEQELLLSFEKRRRNIYITLNL